jgi:predicted nucleic acid-binding protein
MIVLDSSFLVAYHNRRDVHHRAAAATMERLVADEWGPATSSRPFAASATAA